MKIAILADSIDSQKAGVHVFTKSLVHELIHREDGNSYILIRLKKDESLPDSVKQIIVPTIQIPIGYSSFRLFYLIPKILRMEKVDAVFEPAHFGPLNLPKNILRLTFIHDLTPIKFPSYHRWNSQFLQRLFLKGILTKTDHIFTNSQSTSADLEHFYPVTKGKNTAILLGKDPFYQKQEEGEQLLQHGIKKPYFLTVGTIEPRKNHSLLLNAFETFARQNQEVQMVIVGRLGWKFEEFEAKLASFPFKDRVIHLGFVEKSILPKLYSHCIAMVYPSFYEGFGFPILEAMSCGAPVICSNTSSMPEVGGDIAHYIDPHSKEEILSQMQMVYGYNNAKRQEISDASIRRSEEFSWKSFADKFLSVISTL